LKFGIPVLAIVIGLAFIWAIFTTSTPPTAKSQSPAHSQTSQDDVGTADPMPAVTTPATADALSRDAVEPKSQLVLPPIDGLHTIAAEQAQISTIGSLNPDSNHVLEAQLTGWGGAIRYIRLSQYSKTSTDESPFVVQLPVEAPLGNGQNARLYPFAARAITVNSVRIDLEQERWQLTQPGMYEIELADGQNRPVLHISRRYHINPDGAAYNVLCDQTIKNLSADQSLQIVWEQYAQGDLPNDDATYLGDRRKLAVGYHNLEYDPAGQFVYTKNTYLTRRQVIDGNSLWHGNDKLSFKRTLVWVAAMDRYFTVAVFRPSGPEKQESKSLATLDSLMHNLGLRVLGPTGKDNHKLQAMAFTLSSKRIDLNPGDQASLDLAIYAGPRKSEIFELEPYKHLGFSKLVIYELGCALFTFQPLAKGLLKFLKGLHFVVRDWGIAIIFLVLCVRLLLHPITKRAQVNMFKMSKQMQTLQPEIEKLKKKYTDDQKKFQQEQLNLWREKGVNPANMLGCLPMFLQTPIWIALYAMLYLAIELRHQPAFYGVFQWISGGQWQFLADLSSPDNFIRFAGEGFKLNLYFIHPTFAAINILPILMAGVFYVQQKLTTPPPANEQAAQQQKIMKYMVLLFPVMLYSAPSGLTLYILSSTFAGIIDSYTVRKHVKEQEKSGTLFDKKPIKPGGFMDRMQKAVQQKQKMFTTQQKRQAGNAPKRRKR